MNRTNRIFFAFLLLMAAYPAICHGQIPAQAAEQYRKPALENRDSWSLILIPDPQNYVKYGRNQPILDLMTSWIHENIDSLNIRMVMCTGDLVEQNDRINRGVSGNQSSQHQWEAIARSMGKLDGHVPYITATGNHDYTYEASGLKTSRFREFFPVDKNFLNRKIICQNTLNAEGLPTLENSAYEIKSLHGRDYLFLTLEFAPRDTVLAWASRVAALEEYRNHRIVLLTHAYLNSKSERTRGAVSVTCYNPYAVNGAITKRKQKLTDANSGEDIWQKLVRPASNIELVLCGHISVEGYRTDRNAAGKTVHQMLFDTQTVGGGHYGNGGDGWLRILEFLPDGETVVVKTFSPLFAISPTTQVHAWKKDAGNAFTLKFDER
ncbi:MAG: metallophosphoesterase [Tannerella sp.]|jgi:predicted MPP superfamily phosphohydrolase|nr:metallophosphoesterase [Tannerella sp.]